MTVRIGLVSDTHMPMRLRELPAPLFTALRGVDLLLHAGDVGKLSTLDELSELAPVVAVHGNDDSEEARQFLPYKTVVPCAGERIFLWHSHYEDRQEEFASREGDEIVPKLHRISPEAAAAGAHVAVFGHWHIPLRSRSGRRDHRQPRRRRVRQRDLTPTGPNRRPAGNGR